MFATERSVADRFISALNRHNF